MSTEQRKIGWGSWNAKIQEVVEEEDNFSHLDELLSSATGDEPPEEIKFISARPRVIQTPYGPFFLDSFLKPSDRWDCWLAYTNFDVTKTVATAIENTKGVEALKILGRYTFFIGVGKLFDIKHVRLSIEDSICNYTEDSLEMDLEPHLSETINNLKEQVGHSNFWSIFVSPEGDVDYVMSDQLDDDYLNGLDDLEKLRIKFGGIILRSGNG